MIANIMFFIAWTVLVFFIAISTTKNILKEQKKLIESQDKTLNILTVKLDEAQDRLKLRINQNDTLLQTVDILNKKIQDGKNETSK